MTVLPDHRSDQVDGQPAGIPFASFGEVDEIDRKILQQLRVDGRGPLGILGNEVGLSGDAVRERLKRLRAAGVFRVTGNVDPHVLGFNILALIGLTLRGPAALTARELVAVSEFDLVGCTAGRYDVLVEAVCRDEAHLLTTLDRWVRSRPDVTSTTVFSYLEVLKFEPGSMGQPSRRIKSNSRIEYEPDEQDIAIIRVLQDDGRATFREIGERSDIPYQTARRRTKALLDSGVVRIETVINRVAEGSAVAAAIGLQTTGPLSEIKARLQDLEVVEVAVVTTGPYDILLDVVCRDRAHLADVVGNQLRRIPGVLSTETHIYQQMLKLPQAWSGLTRSA